MKTLKTTLAVLLVILCCAAVLTPACAETVITEAYADYLPEAGDKAHYGEIDVKEPGKYTASIEKIYYYDGSDLSDLKEGDIFEAGKTYRMKILFTAKEGYEFGENTVYYINGSDSIAKLGNGLTETTVEIKEESSLNIIQRIINFIKEAVNQVIFFFEHLFPKV